MRNNRHHLFFPRRDYKTALERKFRSLPCFIVKMDIEAHKLLHATQKPPIKPRVSEMREAVKRHKRKECGCYE